MYQYEKAKYNKLFYTAALCMLIGLIARVSYHIAYPVPVRDSYKYVELIENWNKGIKATNRIPPLSIYIMGIPNRITGYDVYKGGIILNEILSLCTIYVFIQIMSLFTNSNGLLFCIGFAFSTHPTLVKLSGQLLRESPFLFLLCLSLKHMILYLKHIGNQYTNIVLSAFFVSSACFCRYESIELVIITILLLLFLKTKKPIKIISLYLLSFVLSTFFILYYLGLSYIYLNTFIVKLRYMLAI